MEHAQLGNTGLKVRRLALGCLSYGDPTTSGAHEWSLNDDEAQPFFRQAAELRITFSDTANTYQAGTSEELVGRAIKRYSRREDILLATKVWGRMDGGPGGQGPSRKAIFEQIDARPSRDLIPTTSTSTRSTPSTRTPGRGAADPGGWTRLSRCRTSATCCAAKTSRS